MIKNRKKLLKNFPDSRLFLDIADEALNFLSPENLIKNSVKLTGSKLQIEKAKFDLKKYKKIFVIGAGKATYSMAKEINKLLGNRITEGFINVPEAITKNLGKIKVNKAGHPFPDENGLKGTQEILKIAKKAGKDDLVICLISGGGSAMLPAPIAPLSLKDKVEITKQLLKSTATIHEINTVRKHLSEIKGGNLAAKIMPADLIALYISDVKNDDLDIIASGPTVLDKSTSKDALNVLKKYGIKNAKAEKVLAVNETPKSINDKKVKNYVIGSNTVALKHLQKFLEKKKYSVEIFPDFLEGEAKLMPKKLFAKSKQKNKIYLFGGETVVKIIGKGFGGRNQELALSAINEIPSISGIRSSHEQTNHHALMSLATDGVDGIAPVPVAGAIITRNLKKLCKEKNIDIEKYLQNNDSYTALKNLDCLIYTGPSGTNVGDIVVVHHSSLDKRTD
ncbi:MAG: DUF4147 domain-containing protein [Candidatus Peregrinibacteria bacterium]|nr:DUF4147 domain-containing protein [Candidatus Peregrinibacteria bacterium]